MTTYDMPASPAFVDAQFYLEHHSQIHESRISRAVKRQELDGARWIATYSLPAMGREKGAIWKAFFAQLKGQVNSFNAYDPDEIYPQGPAGGSPVVNGASQTGITLDISGCTPSTLFLMAGDKFTWSSGELKMLTANAIADGSGNVTLNFEPYIRTSPSNGAAIITTKPTCRMILTDDRQGVFNRNHNGIYMPKTFTAIEELP